MVEIHSRIYLFFKMQSKSSLLVIFFPLIIVAKASDGQRYLLPLSLCLAVCDGERGSGPEGADDVGF